MYPAIRKLLGLLLLLLVGAALVWAQDDNTQVHITPRVKPQSNSESAEVAGLDTHTPAFRADVNLVLVPVTVTDGEDRVVTGLDKTNFAIYDEKREQAIQTFSSVDAPISLGIIFDMSGSMSDKIEKAREAVVQFLQTANPEDEFFLIAFSDKPELLSGFSSVTSDVQNKMLFTAAKGRTALIDAVYLGVHEMRDAHHRRKALLIISDGGDNNSRYTEGELKQMVEEADLQIYSIGIFDVNPATPEERSGPQLLTEISEATGGRSYTVNDPNELADVATKISTELRNQYVLGYRLAALSKNGKWHRIRVKLLPPKGLPPLTSYAKKGYYAPSQ